MLGLPTTTLPTDIGKFKEFERVVLEGGKPTADLGKPNPAPVVQVSQAPAPVVTKTDQLLKNPSIAPEESDVSIRILQELFEQTYASLSQTHCPTKGQESVAEAYLLQADVKMAFSQLRDKVSSLVADRIHEEKTALLELQELKHEHVLLQAEFQSKFEKDKTISLTIPNKPNRKLFARQDSNDSANSFIPLEGETFEDYKLRDLERKAQKLQDALSQGKAAEDSDSEGENKAIPGIDEPLQPTVPKSAEVQILKSAKPSPAHEDHDHDEHGHEHEHGHDGRGFCACRRRGDHTHRHLYMDTHQMHYGL